MFAYSAAGNQYKQQSAMTASPGELTLMLYDGCVKNLKLNKMHIESGDYVAANVVSQKAQNILAELARSLDMRYDISNQLQPLYDFMLNELIASNLKKDVEKVEFVLEMVTELRDTWRQAVRINRQQSTAVRSAAGA